MKKLGYPRAGARYSSPLPFSTLVRGISTVATIGSMLRFLSPRRRGVLAWLGLSRRRSLLGTTALVGAGVALGAGAGLLLTPVAGQQARRSIGRWFQNLSRRGEEILHQAESAIQGQDEGQGHNGHSQGQGSGQGQSRGEGMSGSTRSSGGGSAASAAEGSTAGSRMDDDGGNVERSSPLRTP